MQNSETVNISTKDKLCDPHYRYRREKVKVSFSDRFGGTTIISNWENICKQLAVEQESDF